MSLRTEIQLNIHGIYVNGNIVSGVFRSQGLINISNDKNQYRLKTIEKVIQELQELADLLNGAIVADTLAPDAGIEEHDWENL